MIDGIKNSLGGIQSIPAPQEIKPSGGNTKGGSFADALKSALDEVDRLQVEADTKIERLSTGKGDVTPHDAMIALEKADVAFQLMTTIKSKIVRAYEEVIRTQV
mgnify:CR=1 FL=1